MSEIASQDSILSEDGRWGDDYFSLPDNLTRLFACTKKVNLECIRLNFVRFTNVKNLAFILPLLSIDQFMVHGIEKVNLIFSLG